MPSSPPPPPAEPATTLTGVVERITFQSRETGYVVARLDTGRRRLTTIVGHMPALRPGETVTLEGHWTIHPQHGRQFNATQCRLSLPATLQGIEKYLASGLIRGLGPVGARAIVTAFGLQTLEVIEQTPERLREVPGVGPQRISQITAAWREQKTIGAVMALLQSFELPTALAARIYRAFGDAAVSVIQETPYRLVGEVEGVGFGPADALARRLGLPLDAPERIAAAVLECLRLMADEEGHVCLPRPDLIERARERLTQDILPAATWEMAIDRAIDRLLAAARLQTTTATSGNKMIYLTVLAEAEAGLVGHLRRLTQTSLDRLADFQAVDFERAFAWLRLKDGVELVPRQREAVHQALTARVSLLTGGPGTGKTTCLRAVVRLATARGRRVTLVAPTGRAARRLADVTGATASTVHRLLGMRSGQAAELDSRQPLATDLVIIDEASMLDLPLAQSLVAAIAPGTHLLLVGDRDQLPSVGPGMVLADLIRSDIFPVTRLETVFRQASESLIIQNAHRVIAGATPAYGAAGRSLAAREDFFLLPVTTAEAAAERAVELVATRLPRRFDLAPGDIQVLAPMHRGPAGVVVLNERLQAAVNPPAADRAEYQSNDRRFRLGDRLLVTRNDYDRQVFNGDLGVIQALDPASGELTVRLDDGRTALFGASDFDELQLAYALSIHKSQGAEFRAVVLVLLTSHHVMLARNLLYTGLTRARELVVVVGQARALAVAVQNNRVTRRHSLLSERLVREMALP